MTEALSQKTIARAAAVMFLIGGDVVGLGSLLLPTPENANQIGMMAVGFAAAILGGIFWFLPWDRWSSSASLWTVAPAAYIAIAAFNYFTGNNAHTFGIFFVTIQSWIGIAHPQGSSMRTLPLLVPAISAPLMLSGTPSGIAIYSVFFTAFACVVAGETVAWVSRRLSKALQDLRWLAGHDPLTGAANRRALFEHVAVGGRRRPRSVAVVDVDGLKTLNDRFGHAFGDAALITVAARLNTIATRDDLVARVGGDEFVLLSFSRSAEELEAHCHQSLGAPLEIEHLEQSAAVGVSYGTAAFSQDVPAIEAALSLADTRMYEAKPREVAPRFRRGVRDSTSDLLSPAGREHSLTPTSGLDAVVAADG